MIVYACFVLWSPSEQSLSWFHLSTTGIAEQSDDSDLDLFALETLKKSKAEDHGEYTQGWIFTVFAEDVKSMREDCPDHFKQKLELVFRL